MKHLILFEKFNDALKKPKDLEQYYWNLIRKGLNAGYILSFKFEKIDDENAVLKVFLKNETVDIFLRLKKLTKSNLDYKTFQRTSTDYFAYQPIDKENSDKFKYIDDQYAVQKKTEKSDYIICGMRSDGYPNEVPNAKAIELLFNTEIYRELTTTFRLKMVSSDKKLKSGTVDFMRPRFYNGDYYKAYGIIKAGRIYRFGGTRSHVILNTKPLKTLQDYLDCLEFIKTYEIKEYRHMLGSSFAHNVPEEIIDMISKKLVPLSKLGIFGNE